MPVSGSKPAPLPARPAGGAGAEDGALLRSGTGVEQDRRREHRPPDVLVEDLDRLGAELWREVDEVLHPYSLQLERRRLRGERLGRRKLLARHVRLRHGPLLDRPYRLARRAVENVGEGLLARLGHRLDCPPVDGDVDQHGRRREVVVPDAVVDGLEVPHPLAGPRIDADEALGEEVVAGPVPAVVVVGRRRRAAGRTRPSSSSPVGCAHMLVLPLYLPRHAVVHRVGAPGLDAELVLERDGVERPEVLARAHVVPRARRRAATPCWPPAGFVVMSSTNEPMTITPRTMIGAEFQ